MPCYNSLGNLADGRPFWDAKFSQANQADLVFYYPGDGRWWLWSLGNAPAWSSPGSTSGIGPNDPDYGQIWDGRPFWVADFNGDGKAEVLFYYPGDGNWQLGTFFGSSPNLGLGWHLVDNTNNFGQVWDGRPFWVADFNGDGKADVLFHYPGDGNWWLGTFGGSPPVLTWDPVGNTNNFGQVWDGRPFWVADFNGDGKAEVLFHFPGDGNWWLGTFVKSPSNEFSLEWGKKVGNTNAFGQVWDGRPFWVADFNGDGKAEVLFHSPGDGNWLLGTFIGSPPDLNLGWEKVGNTNNFGQIWDGRPFWANDFNGDGRTEILFYYPGNGNWHMGIFPTPTSESRVIDWNLIGNTGRPFNRRLRLHIKIVNNSNPSVPIATMVNAMQLLFAQASILVEWVSTENLNIPFLADVDVLECLEGQTTDEQDTLFQNRNNAEPNDIVVYFVRSTIPPLGGCAAYPVGSPGAIVTQRVGQWVLAHEVGHVLGLDHILGEHLGCPDIDPDCCSNPDFTRLMTDCGTGNIVGTPLLSRSEIATIQDSYFVQEC